MSGDGIISTLLDLVVPGGCAGCGGAGRTVICAECAADLGQPPEQRRPRPAPPGLPACVAGGDYDGPLREFILAYKEHGRRGLAAPLGDRLAAVVSAGWPAPDLTALALVPVPATAAAIRARHGDHMLRLAQRAARTLRGSGVPAIVATPLRALPRPDSAHLDREARAAAARTAFAVRWRSPVRLAALASVADAGAVVLVDDVLTTGATLAAAALELLDAGVAVTFAATLAATRRHGGAPASRPERPSPASRPERPSPASRPERSSPASRPERPVTPDGPSR